VTQLVQALTYWLARDLWIPHWAEKRRLGRGQP